MKLFITYIGGRADGANIELHDVRFVIGENIEACHQQLRDQWWGRPKSLHIDCWGALDYADGYDISVEQQPSTHTQHLYFINMGGYDPAQFAELHKNIFLVAESEAIAKERALKAIEGWHLPHKDYSYEVDTIVSLSDVAKEKGLYIHLKKSAQEKPFIFKCDYTQVGKA